MTTEERSFLHFLLLLNQVCLLIPRMSILPDTTEALRLLVDRSGVLPIVFGGKELQGCMARSYSDCAYCMNSGPDADFCLAICDGHMDLRRPLVLQARIEEYLYLIYPILRVQRDPSLAICTIYEDAGHTQEEIKMTAQDILLSYSAGQ